MAASGSPIGHKYLRFEVIGRGAMGTVYRGEDVNGRQLAIKVLRPELSDDPILVARFVQERALLVRLAGPGIVQVVDLVLEGDLLAIVMERVNGGSLRDFLVNGHEPLNNSVATGLTADVLSGLAVAHSQGVVHRDVKPENILIEKEEEPIRALLTDFGISGLTEGSSHTRMTSVVGTPEYMAPEIIDGEPATSAVDVYSCGIVLYELLAGRTPFSGGHAMAVLKRHVEQEPLRPDSIGDGTWALIQQMLAKDRSTRPGAEEAAERLRQIAVEVPVDSGRIALPAELTDESTNLRSMPTPPSDGQDDQHPTVQRTVPLIAGATSMADTQLRPDVTTKVGPTGAASGAPSGAGAPGESAPWVPPSVGVAYGSAKGNPEAVGNPAHRKPTAWIVGSILVVALLAGVYFAVHWFDTNAYFVQTKNNELVIYQGRVGGGVLNKPVEVERTGVTVADVPAYSVPSLTAGIQEDSLKSAQAYVAGLVATQHQAVCRQDPTAVGCTTTGNTAASTTPTTTTVPIATIADPSAAGTIGTKPTITVPPGAPPTRLESKDLIIGTGPAIKAGEKATVQYVGVAYSSGQEFDSSWSRNQPFPFALGQGQVIAGWDQGIVGMQVGGRRELIIPPNLAYGAQSPGAGIAANDTLIFIVDLVKIN